MLLCLLGGTQDMLLCLLGEHALNLIPIPIQIQIPILLLLLRRLRLPLPLPLLLLPPPPLLQLRVQLQPTPTPVLTTSTSTSMLLLLLLLVLLLLLFLEYYFFNIISRLRGCALLPGTIRSTRFPFKMRSLARSMVHMASMSLASGQREIERQKQREGERVRGTGTPSCLKPAMRRTGVASKPTTRPTLE